MIKRIYGQIMEYDNRTTAVLLLISVLLFIFAFRDDSGGFIQGHHGVFSAHGLALAKNLSPEHNFLLFDKMFWSNGGVDFSAYGRFPITSFLLIKIPVMLTSPNLSMEITAARSLMYIFLFAAMVLAVLITYEFVGSYFVAISAALLSFSSYYLIYYGDVIFYNTPAVFGLLLAFYGLVVYHKRGGFGRLIVLFLIGLSFGWPVFALLVIYVFLALLVRFSKERSILMVIRSDDFKLGVIGVLFSFSLLFLNIGNEYLHTGKSLRDLDTVDALLRRSGLVQNFSEGTDTAPTNILNFTNQQLLRLGVVFFPSSTAYFTRFVGLDYHHLVRLFGLFSLIVAFIVIPLSKNKLLLFSLFLSGFLWMYGAKDYTAYHDVESVFYVGASLAVYIAILSRITKKWRILILPVLLLSLFLFTSSYLLTNRNKAYWTDAQNTITYDFQRIADIVGTGAKVYYDGRYVDVTGTDRGPEFFLSGNYIVINQEDADYVVSRNRDFNSNLLTPDNWRVFLFKNTVKVGSSLTVDFLPGGQRYWTGRP
ncbi:MAG: hypothetical protein GXP38_04700 [Chloroflexi bacterium]|nr:hypothetical protein [Chloroflexota bacterium]